MSESGLSGEDTRPRVVPPGMVPLCLLLYLVSLIVPSVDGAHLLSPEPTGRTLHFTFSVLLSAGFPENHKNLEKFCFSCLEKLHCCLEVWGL